MPIPATARIVPVPVTAPALKFLAMVVLLGVEPMMPPLLTVLALAEFCAIVPKLAQSVTIAVDAVNNAHIPAAYDTPVPELFPVIPARLTQPVIVPSLRPQIPAVS